MKKALLAVLVACLMVFAVGCSSGGTTAPANKSNTEPMEINLNTEETEYHGVHVRIFDSLQLSEDDNGEITSVNNLNEPITGEVLFNASFESAETLNESTTYDDTVSGKYTPEEALIKMGGQDTNEYWEYKTTRLGGTDVQVSSRIKQEGDYESTEYRFILNSGIVKFRYDDRGGKYTDLIQQSLDSIWIDESEIPDIIKATSPESLQAAGLRVQPWEIECGSDSIYINMPEEYTAIKLDDGRIAWASPDGQTILGASITDRDFLLREQSDFENSLQNTQGFEGFDFFSRGSYNGMYYTNFQYKQINSDGAEVYAYVLATLPWKYGKEAVLMTVVSPSDDEDVLQTSLDLIRYGDGWNNGGVLDIDSIAVPQSELGV